MIRFDNVGLRYGSGPEILRDVTFHVLPGSFHFLTGPSGAGKTSLLRTAMHRSSALMDADARTIGIDVATWHPEGKGDGKLVINVWDFAGQQDYYATCVIACMRDIEKRCSGTAVCVHAKSKCGLPKPLRVGFESGVSKPLSVGFQNLWDSFELF